MTHTLEPEPSERTIDGAATANEPFRMASLGRHSLVYGVGMLLTKAVAIVMLPIYTRWLTPADYGVLQLITMTFEVVTIIAGSRIAMGIFHFYHKETHERGRRKVLSTALLLLGATYGGAATATMIAAPAIADLVFGQSGQYTLLVRMAAVSMAFEGLILVPNALFQLQDRSTLFVTVSLVRLGLQVALNLVFLIGFEMGVFGVLLGSLITHAVIGVLLAVRLLAFAGLHFDTSAARAFLRFGMPLVAMQIATFITTFGDRYFLNKASDTTEVGLYGLAYQLGFLVATLGFLPVQRVWDPQRFAVAKRPDRDVIFAQVFVYASILLLSAALAITLFAEDVLRAIATPPFYPAAAFVPVLAGAYVLHCWGTFLNLGIYVTERTEYFTAANWVAAVVALVGYVVLIPQWLAWGAAFATFASVAVRCWLTYTFSQRLWRVEYRWGPVVRVTLLAAAVAGTSLLIPPAHLLVSILVHAGLFAAYAALAWFLPILTPEQRSAIRRRLADSVRLVRARAEAA